MSRIQEIDQLIQQGRGKKVCETIQAAMDEGISAADILREGMLPAMSAIGEKFKNNEVFVPEVLVAARAMNMGMALLKPYMADCGIEPAGTAVIGTVRGDMHDIGKNLDKKLRSILQTYNHANYIFLGSQESMMQEIFEKKKSPFYHFGYLMKLGKIPQDDFYEFLKNGFLLLGKDMDAETIGRSILSFTNCHPYYTQQLAYQTWNNWKQNGYSDTLVETAITELTHVHDMDYERLWSTFNKTDKKVLIGLTMQMGTPSSLPFLQGVGIDSPSTAFSSLKRLGQQGYVIRNEGYELDDPFFRRWIEVKREG